MTRAEAMIEVIASDAYGRSAFSAMTKVPWESAGEVIKRERRNAARAALAAIIPMLADDLAEKRMTCLGCGAIFTSAVGHYDEDCPNGRSAWDGISLEQYQQVVAAHLASLAAAMKGEG